MVVIKRGAEAVISEEDWHGRNVIVKERVPKSYRASQLDNGLRRTRTKKEATLIVEARECGVSTPRIFDIDMSRARLVMERIDGTLAKDLLRTSRDRMRHARTIGENAGQLHSNDIVHGDMTTSNMIFTSDGLTFIDFGLGEKTGELEKKGVDLHLLKEAVNSAHSEFPDLFDAIVEGYLATYLEGSRVVKIMKEIESRW